jgi:hypothetical protein
MADNTDQNITDQYITNQYNMMLSMVVPALGRFLKQMPINQDKLAELCDGNDGCLKVEYKKDDISKVVYIVLQDCDKEHNLTDQFDKLRPFISDDKWQHLLKCMSTIVFLIRSIFKELISKFDVDYALLVDPSNTTLYVDGFPKRIGIFIVDEKIE